MLTPAKLAAWLALFAACALVIDLWASRPIARSTWRGHATHQDRAGVWRYSDTGEAVRANPSRTCGHCHRPDTPEGHDGCLGTLPGVRNACCGHGDDEAAYVQYDDGREFRGVEAAARFDAELGVVVFQGAFVAPTGRPWPRGSS